MKSCSTKRERDLSTSSAEALRDRFNAAVKDVCNVGSDPKGFRLKAHQLLRNVKRENLT